MHQRRCWQLPKSHGSTDGYKVRDAQCQTRESQWGARRMADVIPRARCQYEEPRACLDLVIAPPNGKRNSRLTRARQRIWQDFIRAAGLFQHLVRPHPPGVVLRSAAPISASRSRSRANDSNSSTVESVAGAFVPLALAAASASRTSRRVMRPIIAASPVGPADSRSPAPPFLPSLPDLATRRLPCPAAHRDPALAPGQAPRARTPELVRRRFSSQSTIHTQRRRPRSILQRNACRNL